MDKTQTVVDNLMKFLITTYGPMVVAIALSNASAHGEAINSWLEDDRVDDEHLSQWYDGIETMIDAAERIINNW